jgi:hypothetical protein
MSPPPQLEGTEIKPKTDGKRIKPPDYLYLALCLYQLLEAG